LAHSHNDLGLLLGDTGKLAEAEVEHRHAIAILQELADDNPAVSKFRADLAFDLGTLAYVLERMGRPVEAEAEYRAALALFQNLADDNPAVIDFRVDLARNHNNLGVLLRDTGRLAGVEAELRKALALFQNLADDNPAVTVFRSEMVRIRNNLGGLLAQTGKPLEEAEAECRKALALVRKLAENNPNSPELADSLASYGLMLLQVKAYAAAEPLLREGLAIREKTQPDVWSTFDIKSQLGGSLLGQKKFPEAEPLILAGYEGLEDRAARIPAPRRPRLAEAAARVVQLYEARGQPAKTNEWRMRLGLWPELPAHPFSK
jgi:tetratricopeptide (TPR) repeat protein